MSAWDRVGEYVEYFEGLDTEMLVAFNGVLQVIPHGPDTVGGSCTFRHEITADDSLCVAAIDGDKGYKRYRVRIVLEQMDKEET